MISRRKFLKAAGAGALKVAAGGLGLLSGVQLAAGSKRPPLDLDVELKAVESEVPILPGRATRVWNYIGRVLKGSPQSLVSTEGSYLGPTFRVRKGQRVRVRLVNEIPDETIVHWHGLHLPEEMDGHPRYAIGPGETYVYEFEIMNRAGTYWYHPHPHGRTGPQVLGGMAGLFLVSDDEERSAGLPSGAHDIPLVIQDRIFGDDNQFVYLHHGPSGNLGFLGDRVLINGRPNFTLEVAAGAYRLRLLNGSNSRIYRLAWEDSSPLAVIGTDGGLLEKPVKKSYVMLAPGERVELWADFGGYPVGKGPSLVSLPFDTGMRRGGMMGMARRRPGLPNGAKLTLFNVRVERKMKESPRLPERLSNISRFRPRDAVNLDNPRTFALFPRHMAWTINGRLFEMEAVARDEKVRLGTLEVWEFANMGGMMMGAMPHPMHLHGVQFQVLGRGGVSHSGYLDGGFKDTVLLMPGERVRILVKFEDYPGLFLYHCHNLEHEDAGMMRNYLVRR